MLNCTSKNPNKHLHLWIPAHLETPQGNNLGWKKTQKTRPNHRRHHHQQTIILPLPSLTRNQLRLRPSQPVNQVHPPGSTNIAKMVGKSHPNFDGMEKHRQRFGGILMAFYSRSGFFVRTYRRLCQIGDQNSSSDNSISMHQKSSLHPIPIVSGLRFCKAMGNSANINQIGSSVHWRSWATSSWVHEEY